MREPHKKRLYALCLGIVLLFGALFYRLAVVQLAQHEYFSRLARAQHIKKIKIVPLRGSILDHNHNVLVSSTRLYSVYIYPGKLKKHHPLFFHRLADILNTTHASVAEKFSREHRTLLARRISDQQANELQALRMEVGVSSSVFEFVQECIRLYPKKNLAAHLLGIVTLDDAGDNRGITGLELGYDEFLRAELKPTQLPRTAYRINLQPLPEDLFNEIYGNSMILTVDENIQYVSEYFLGKAVSEFEAKGGGVVVMKTRTAEILALCSLPTFDPRSYRAYPPSHYRIHCVSDGFEPGSVMKIFTAATLLETGLITPDEVIDCEGGKAYFGNRLVRDAPGHKLLLAPFFEVLYYSSNVGTCKAAQRLSIEEFYQYLRRFGFGEVTGIDLPGESPGILRSPAKWTTLSMTSIPIGYEISTNPVQLAAAASALGNSGVLMRPFVVKQIRDYRGELIKRVEPKIRRRVVSRVTAERMLKIMEGVTLYGTGKQAQIPGYRLAAKTGTTQKSHVHTHREYIASFVVMFPLPHPEFTIYVYIDAPQKKHFASEVAAPVTRNIAEYVIKYFNLPPQEEPEQLQLVEEAVPENKTTRKIRMPNLKGLSLIDALQETSQLPLEVQFVGSGLVVEQSPEPEAQVYPDSHCLLILELPGESPGG